MRRDRLLVWACGVLTALAWAAAHVGLQGPRGWPAWELGEWEVMLVTELLVAGESVPLPVGAVHGHGLGSYLMGLMVLPLRWGGLSPLLAAKVGATLVGATTAGVCAGTAAALANRRAGALAGLLAAAVVAGVTAVSWPSFHQELGGVSGRTPDAVLPAVAGALLLFRFPALGLGRTLCAGGLLGLSWVLSPASVWVLGLALVVTSFSPSSAPPEGLLRWFSVAPPRARRPAALLVGLALPVLLMALFLPQGGEGVSAFLHKQVDQVAEALGGQAGTHPTSTGDRGPLRALAAVPSVFGVPSSQELAEGVAGRVPPIGWLVLVGGLGALLVAGVSREWTSEALLSLTSLSFVVPLGLVSTDGADLGAAARYFAVPLCLALVATAATLAAGMPRWPRASWLCCGVVLVWALVPATGLNRTLSAPAWTLQDSLMSTGAHGLPIFEGRGRHYAFRSLFAGVPTQGRAAFVEGYGMDLGGEAAQELWGGTPPSRSWEALLDEISATERSALLLGVGCGLGRLDVDGGVLLFVSGCPVAHHSDLFYGLGLCAYDRLLTHPSSVSAAEEDLARLSEGARRGLLEGREDANRPFPRAPRRSAVPVPAERMRALPPPGPRTR